ncbi:unnamed protein product [Tuwongella immobilis]|uniref:Uncharacterized protein n=1 Tax=Tuwongella immobilis TaxID=692036 RepID=A0A6C2YLX0_9BACT|nr:unnamed protein product [Tuwongella immobilis]VTS01823.1 unnamed protein product [Tuwongella immobilis]
MSGQEDLNLRPFGPEPNALAKLSYGPNFNVPFCETESPLSKPSNWETQG